MRDTSLFRCSPLIVVAALFVCTAACFAQDGAANLERKVAAEVEKRLAPAKIAKQLELPYPVPEPTMTMEEVKAQAGQAARKDVEEKYPVGHTTLYRKEAEKKYPLREVGDEVSFVIRGGRGLNARVEGTLRHVGPERVQVDRRWISRSDIDEQTLARLDPELNKKAVEAYVRSQLVNSESHRNDYFKERYRFHGKRLMKKAHYRHYKGKWMPAKEYFQKALEFRRKQLAKDVRAELQKKTGSDGTRPAASHADAEADMFESMEDPFGTQRAAGDAADGGGSTGQPTGTSPGGGGTPALPDQQVRGQIQGEPFTVNAAVVHAGQLQLAQMTGWPPEMQIDISLWLDDIHSVGGKTFTGNAPPDKSAPIVSLKVKEPPQSGDVTKSQTKVVAEHKEGYDMNLTFGPISNGTVPGEISLKLPGQGNFVKGTFTAHVGKTLYDIQNELEEQQTGRTGTNDTGQPAPDAMGGSSGMGMPGGAGGMPFDGIDSILRAVKTAGLVPRIIGFGIMVLMIASMWVLFSKAEQPGWAAVVPVYNFYVLFEVIHRPKWWVALVVLPWVFAGLVQALGAWLLLILLPLVIATIFIHFTSAYDLATTYGKGHLFGTSLLFFPYIFLPILAFGKSKYGG